MGQLLNALENLGIADNTMFVFTSDNGGHPEFALNVPLRESKWNLYEGRMRVPMIVRWPKLVEKGTTYVTPTIGMDFMPTFREMVGIASGSEMALDGMSILPVLKDANL
ncbi:MAG: sulfatase-like hydrolase/transferase [Planctomycetes bacterium]|nr:sulfatase-like hydrolase/transferase [Planctomycetota bacterium]